MTYFAVQWVKYDALEKDFAVWLPPSQQVIPHKSLSCKSKEDIT